MMLEDRKPTARDNVLAPNYPKVHLYGQSGSRRCWAAPSIDHLSARRRRLGFHIVNNPNAVSGCGCGNSFRTADDVGRAPFAATTPRPPPRPRAGRRATALVRGGFPPRPASATPCAPRTRIVDRFLAGTHIPGLAYGVVLGGELVHSRGVGTLRVGEDAPPDADSAFRIASMTKSFTAATILGLRDEGQLSLDDPIARHVPELAGLHGPTADAPADHGPCTS